MTLGSLLGHLDPSGFDTVSLGIRGHSGRSLSPKEHFGKLMHGTRMVFPRPLFLERS